MGELAPLDDDLAKLFAEDSRRYEARPSSARDALRIVEQRAALEALGGHETTEAITKKIAAAAWGAKAVAAVAIASFSAGIAVGRFLPTSASPSAPSLSVDAPPSATSSSSQPPTPSTTPPLVTSSSAPPPNPAPELRPLPKTSADPALAGHASESTLMAERDLIDTARAALSRGRADDALSAVERHATRFPNGALAEEREALAVQALSVAGRNDLAKQRAARFHRRYPTSIFGNAIDAVVSEIVRDK